MPLFALSWNIICIGFVLAMNYFAVDYALHLLGISQHRVDVVDQSAITELVDKRDAVSYITIEERFDLVVATIPDQMVLLFSIFSSFQPSLHKGIRPSILLKEIHIASLSRRGPPVFY